MNMTRADRMVEHLAHRPNRCVYAALKRAAEREQKIRRRLALGYHLSDFEKLALRRCQGDRRRYMMLIAAGIEQTPPDDRMEFSSAPGHKPLDFNF
jgi:hypothetical protein